MRTERKISMPDPENTISLTARAGQAIWLDQISRSMIDRGEIDELVDSGVRGITTNPTIFDSAIAEGDAYDFRLAELAKTCSSPEQIFESIAIEDVKDAANILRPLYDRLNRRDGFVSIEVNPHLAHDTSRTVTEARRIWKAVDRPNIMIKVPGTPAGVPAITQLIADGINVNVTLLFSIEAYKAAANAYLDGLELYSRNGKGAANAVASVASFFVSRVDTLVDGRLPGDSPLSGKIGIANAKLAYAEYKRLFARGLNDKSRFFALNTIGAQPQRPLWASTSVKNPIYPPTYYFDNLIGPETVNTLPLSAIAAVMESGTVAETITADVDIAHLQMRALEQSGISYRDVTDQLLEEGIQKFVDSWDSLMGRIESKSSALAQSL